MSSNSGAGPLDAGSGTSGGGGAGSGMAAAGSSLGGAGSPAGGAGGVGGAQAGVGGVPSHDGPVVVEVVADSNGQVRFSTPRDLAFHPWVSDELWVVNYEDNSMVLLHHVGLATQSLELRTDGYAHHFMDEPAALAFGALPANTGDGLMGTLATCQESTNNGHASHVGNFFMGLTLWPASLEAFAIKTEPPPFNFKPNGSSHLDMVHTAPVCVGVAHERDNVYWAFAGALRDTAVPPSSDSSRWVSGIVRVDFGVDHGYGQDDHSDARSKQYVAGLVRRKAGVPSHLALDAASHQLYIADTGNSRIVKLDTESGTVGGNLYNPDGPSPNGYQRMDGATLSEVVSAKTGLLTAPSGLELNAGKLYVSDNATNKVFVFSTAGDLLREIDVSEALETTGQAPLPPGSLSGMAIGPHDGHLYLVDLLGDRVLRVRGLP